MLKPNTLKVLKWPLLVGVIGGMACSAVMLLAQNAFGQWNHPIITANVVLLFMTILVGGRLALPFVHEVNFKTILKPTFFTGVIAWLVFMGGLYYLFTSYNGAFDVVQNYMVHAQQQYLEAEGVFDIQEQMAAFKAEIKVQKILLTLLLRGFIIPFIFALIASAMLKIMHQANS